MSGRRFGGIYGRDLETVRIPENGLSINVDPVSTNILDLVIPGTISNISINNDINEADIVLMEGIETISLYIALPNHIVEIPRSVMKIESGAFANVSEDYKPTLIIRGKTSLLDFTDASGLSPFNESDLIFRN